MAATKKTLLETVAAQIPRISEIRRELHQCPEPGFKEYRTSEIIRTAFISMGIDNFRSVLETGLVVDIKGSRPGPVIAMRADIDGLKIQETTSLSYCSHNKGYSHGCGHDGHTACLIGVAIILNLLKERLPGTVRLIFQPAEETGIGARKMIEADCLGSPLPDAIFALHSWPHLPPGTVASKPGAMTTGNELMEITLIGSGGHAARFSETRNPLLGMADVLPKLYDLSDATSDPEQRAVVSIGVVHGGHQPNAIPDQVKLSGTVRTISMKRRENVHKLIEGLLAKSCASFQLDYGLNFSNYCPPVINAADQYDLFHRTAEALFGPESVAELDDASLGSEDFGSYLEHLPGLLIRLGVGNHKIPLHNGQFNFNDTALNNGIAILAALPFAYQKELEP